MLIMVIGLLAADPFASAKAGIDRYCADRALGCVEYQRREMAAFIRMSVAFKTGQTNAERCMTQSIVGARMVNWTVAANCMRRAVKGHAIGS